MPRFKDYLDADLNIFFNEDEFGAYHNVDGENILVVIDNDLLEEWKASNNYNDPTGIYKADLLFYVKKNVFGAKPAIGQNMWFDGKLYQVSDVKDEKKTYIISLAAHRS